MTAFPQQLYDLVPALYPHFLDILHAARVNGTEFFALSYVKNAGQIADSGETAMMLADLKAVLVTYGGYTEAGAATAVAALKTKGLFGEARISEEEKSRRWPNATGYRDIVYITIRGRRALRRVNNGVERLFADVVSVAPRLISTAILSAVGNRVVPWITKRLEELAANKRGSRKRQR